MISKVFTVYELKADINYRKSNFADFDFIIKFALFWPYSLWVMYFKKTQRFKLKIDY